MAGPRSRSVSPERTWTSASSRACSRGTSDHTSPEAVGTSSQPLQSVGPGHPVEHAVGDGAEGAARRSLVVERHHREAVRGDPGVGEAVPWCRAPRRLRTARGQVPAGEAVGAIGADGGVHEHATLQRPGAAGGGRDLRPAGHVAAGAGRQVDDGGDVRPLLERVAADHGQPAGVEQHLGDPEALVAGDDERLGSVDGGQAALLVDHHRPAAAGGHRLLDRATGGFPGQQGRRRGGGIGRRRARRRGRGRLGGCHLRARAGGGRRRPTRRTGLRVVRRAARGGEDQTQEGRGRHGPHALRPPCSASGGPGWRGSCGRRCATGPGR